MTVTKKFRVTPGKEKACQEKNSRKKPKALPLGLPLQVKISSFFRGN